MMARLGLCLAVCLLGSTVADAMVGTAKRGDATVEKHVVIVASANGSLCSGTALSRDLVLTAAHCVEPGIEAVVFDLRGRTLRPTRVERLEQHPEFDFDASNSAHPTADIAILKLARPLSGRITPASLGAREFFPAGEQFE